MKRVLVPVVFAFAILPFVMVVGRHRANALSSPTCPSPLPTCDTTTVTYNNLKFGCTEVTTNSAGNVKTAILRLFLSSDGTATATIAQNGNQSGTTTFQDFTMQTGLTYCVNNDTKTGYIFLPAAEGCPIPFLVDNGLTELRFIESEENRASAGTCHQE
jgi:hypothetical protein